MDEAFSRTALYACEFFSTECAPAYDPYSPNLLILIIGVLGLGLAVLGAQTVVES